MRIRNKTQISRAIFLTALGCASLSVPSTALSDIYVWGSLSGPASDVATCATSPDAVDVRFTMVSPAGTDLQNSDTQTNTYSGYQTETCGTFFYNTETNGGSAEIVAYNFFGSGPAAAQSVSVELIPSPQNLGVDNLLLGNMLFDWNGNFGIPVSLVWDAQGILGEMDGTPTSFTLVDKDAGTNNNVPDPTGLGPKPTTISITQTANSPFAGIGGIPATDGNDAAWLATIYLALELNQGPQPIASTRYNTTNVPACLVPDPGVDGIFNTGDDIKDCMTQNPSADITASIVVDTLTNPVATAVSGTYFDGTLPPYPTATTDGMGGNPMQDGPFTGFNANFDWNNFKLIGFSDTTAPVITLNAHVSPAGTSSVTLLSGTDTYSEPGATCTDAAPLNTDLNADVVVGGDAVIDTAGGTYVVTYSCTDPSGNMAVTATRTVVVIGAGPPAITLGGTNPVTQECAVAYTDAGATCFDAEDGAIAEGTNFYLDQSAVDAGINTVGSYNAIWACQDVINPNPLVTASRAVNVVDTTAPVVTLLGATLHEVIGSTSTNTQLYSDPGADVTDSCDSNVPVTITATSGSVSMTVADSQSVVPYSLTYSVTDADGNTGSVVRSVEVSRAQPVITLLGGASVVLDVGDVYTEQGFDIEDLQDGNLTAMTTTGVTAGNGAGGLNLTHAITGVVDTSVEGAYILTYDVTDSDGNPATSVTRTVIVGVFASASNFTMLNAGGDMIGGTNDVVFDWPAAQDVIAGDMTSLNMSESDVKFNMSITSEAPWPFFDFIWTAHSVRVFGPGTYSFDTGCTVTEIQSTGCPAGTANNSGPAITMTVPAGHVGAHILFDWSNSTNIDVVNVWDYSETGVWDRHGGTGTQNQLYDGLAGVAPDPLTTWKLVSIDVNSNGINGSPMVDGPFQNFSANFNAGPSTTAGTKPPYVGTAQDTELGDNVLGSLHLWGLFVGFLSLLGLRRLGNKH